MVKHNRTRRLPDPFDDPLVEALLQGFHRSAKTLPSRPTRAAAAATARAIEAAAHMALDDSEPVDRRIAAAGLVLGYSFCFRPRTLQGVLPEHWRTLTHHIEFTVAQEKTGRAYDQARTILVSLHDNPLVSILSFVQRHSAPNTPVWPQAEKSALKGLLCELHPAEAERIALNSLRPGGASCASLYPGGRERLRSIGNWRSSAADRYTRANYIPPSRGGLVDKIMSALYAPIL